MKNFLFFVTHSTLEYEHADLCFFHLGRSINPIIFDVLYIYNTHQDELSNQDILKLIDIHDIRRFCLDVQIFNYNNNTPKTLGADLYSIFSFSLSNFQQNDRIFILKSDIMVSVNLLNDFKNISQPSFVATPPYITAKARISNDKIKEYTSRTYVKLSDEITFFNEDENGSPENDRKYGRSLFDHQIEFISCTVKGDFSSHFLTCDNIFNVHINSQSWGGISFSRCRDKWIQPPNSFVVHKYHSIISKNRSNDRIGCEYLLEGI